jgi:hypothetical protein
VDFVWLLIFCLTYSYRSLPHPGVGIDYGGLFADSRPAILNQPIVTAAQLAGDADALNKLITDALRRTAPENGGDIPGMFPCRGR